MGPDGQLLGPGLGPPVPLEIEDRSLAVGESHLSHPATMAAPDQALRRPVCLGRRRRPARGADFARPGPGEATAGRPRRASTPAPRGAHSRLEVMERPSFRVSIANFREYDAPFFTKVRMAFANNMIKLRTRSEERRVGK